MWGVFKIFVGASKIWPDPLSRTLPSARPSLRRTAQNFALFPLSHHNFFLSSLSLGSFRGILVVFLKAGASNVHVWRSRVVV